MSQLRPVSAPDLRGRKVITTPSPRRAARRQFPWFKYLSLAPLILLSAAFVAYPVFELIKTSLGEVSLAGGEVTWTFVGIDNFAKMFQDEIFPVSVMNSVVFIVATVALTVVIGVGLAFVTDQLVRGKAFFQNVLIWPAVLAPVVISVLWLLILSPQLGLVNKAFDLVGLPTQTLLGDPVGAMISIIVVDVWHWTPVVYLLIYTALRAIDSSIIEAASVDGASYLTTVRTILLPLLMPAIAGVIAVRVIMGVKVFDEMYLLTFGGPGISTTVVSLYIRTVFFDRLDFGYGSALSITIIVAVLAVLVLVVSARSFLARIRS